MSTIGGDRPVVVGVDGSVGSGRALLWAAREAVRLGAPLLLVDVPPVPIMVTSMYGSVPYVCDDLALDDAARDVLRKAAEEVRQELGDDAPPLHQVVMPGGAAASLVEASSGARLLVVGARGLGGFARLALGSVSSACIHRAISPVAVIGGDHAVAPGSGPIVVGVDDSAGAREALRWAVVEAAAWDVDLVVAHGWETPFAVPPGGFAFTEMRPEDFLAHADRLMDALIAEAEEATGASPKIRRSTVPATAAQAVLETAKNEDASLLVVGSRGRGGFAGALLGSVSQQCAHHADRPFVVVRAGTTDHL